MSKIWSTGGYHLSKLQLTRCTRQQNPGVLDIAKFDALLDFLAQVVIAVS